MTFDSDLNGHSLVAVAVGLYPVVRTVYACRPDLSFRSRAVVEAVLLSGGSIGTAQQVAPYLGLHNRFKLARFLKREGLPPLHDLAAWASVLAWMDRSEHTGCSLCQLAFGAKRDPAVCYRTVKRITGLQWRDLRRKGLAWVVDRFVARCGTNADSSATAPVR